MKRFFFLAAAATAMLAACNKTEIVPTGDVQEIAFTAVNKVATKTPVDGATFQTTDNMQVAAYIVEGTTPNNFFDKTLFKHSSGNIWSGQPARYWPLTTSTINFLAVTEKGGNVDNTEVTFHATNYASAATVDLSDNANYDQNDLMFAAGTGRHTQGAIYNTVDMKFKHALAWINFQVATTTPAASTDEGCTITVNSIKLNGAVYDGTLALTNDQYLSTSANTTELVETEWSYTVPTPATEVFVPNAAGDDKAPEVTLDSELELFGNGLLVVPDAYATSFTINYTLTQNGGTANTFDYTYTLPTPPAPQTTYWEMAKKYFYNINITLSEIEVTPSISDWDDQGKPTPLS